MVRVLFFLILLSVSARSALPQFMDYAIVGTHVTDFYSHEALIEAPLPGEAFYGQDATYTGNQPSYTINNDGTITDNITGLMWEQDMGEKITYAEAFQKASASTLGGHNDWRVPTIKELYSLILFTGRVNGTIPYEMFIDTACFSQPLGDEEAGERLIDAQTWSATQYKSTTMNGDSTVFGVNFLDGRIKGYPKYEPGTNNSTPRIMYFRLVRGNTAYGHNDFIDNGDGTITDRATGLMWQQADDGIARNWEEALAYAEGLELAGYNDWRLPDAKELQSIVDYSRCPDVTNSPAINPVFLTTSIDDPEGNSGQYPYFWTSTTHLDGNNPYSGAVYIAFGEAQGKMNNALMDVHGAGAQRSDPKSGNKSNYPAFFGPQGDVQYVYNYVRGVRNAGPLKTVDVTSPDIRIYPNPAKDKVIVALPLGTTQVRVLVSATNGKVLKKYNVESATTISIDTRNLKPGIYIVKIIAGNTAFSKKLIIN